MKKTSVTVPLLLVFPRLNAVKIQSKVSIISIANILAPKRLAIPKKSHAGRSVINARPLVVLKAVELV